MHYVSFTAVGTGIVLLNAAIRRSRSVLKPTAAAAGFGDVVGSRRLVVR